MRALLLSRRHRLRWSCEVCDASNVWCAQFLIGPQCVNGAYSVVSPQFMRICGGCLRQGIDVIARRRKP